MKALLFLLLTGMLGAVPTIHLIGDSTMADKPRLEHPERGWGQLFRELVRDSAKVENHARNGRSTKSFINEGRWQEAYDQLRVGDWLIIQFGHNDEKQDNPKVYAAPHGDYARNLRHFVRAAISQGARPVLATPVARRRWDEQGKWFTTHGEYPDAVRRVAREEGVPLLDLLQLTTALEQSLGVEESKSLHLWFEPGEHPALPKGIRDDTHYSEKGARLVAQLAAARLHELGLDIARHIDWSSFETPPAPWHPDLGDGTYRNPVINADYSDPDVVHVGEDFYMTSSSFSHSPGLPILHSRDLVNWTLLNHALPQLPPSDHFSTPRHGGGVWAPAIRRHDGLYHIFWGDPDFGIYQVNAADPAGKWSEPHLVIPGKGLIDPCPLWTEDGRVFLVHAWAKSRSGIQNKLGLRELTADARSVKPGDESRVIIDGDLLPGYRTLEGPKFYQKDGWFWILAPAGGVPTGWQSAFRSRDVEGPYEERIVLAQGRTEINGPHQGGWVTTPGGEDWFLHFQDREAMGRVVHLQPMHWTDDGWPVIGTDPDGNGRGEPVARHRKPDLPTAPRAVPPTTDHFPDGRPGLQWQWQANVDDDYSNHNSTISLPIPQTLRTDDNLWEASRLQLQKPTADDFQVDTRITLSAPNYGLRTGLLVFGEDYQWLGLQGRGTDCAVVRHTRHDARTGGDEAVEIFAETDQPSIWLRLYWRDAGADCRWAYSLDGEQFTELDGSFRARPGRWVGAKFGVFARDVKGRDVSQATVSPVRISPLHPQP